VRLHRLALRRMIHLIHARLLSMSPFSPLPAVGEGAVAGQGHPSPGLRPPSSTRGEGNSMPCCCVAVFHARTLARPRNSVAVPPATRRGHCRLQTLAAGLEYPADDSRQPWRDGMMTRGGTAPPGQTGRRLRPGKRRAHPPPPAGAEGRRPVVDERRPRVPPADREPQTDPSARAGAREKEDACGTEGAVARRVSGPAARNCLLHANDCRTSARWVRRPSAQIAI